MKNHKLLWVVLIKYKEIKFYKEIYVNYTIKISNITLMIKLIIYRKIN